MTMSNREKVTASITLVVLLFGVLGLLSKGPLENWRLKRLQYRQACDELVRAESTIQERSKWEQQYAGVRDLMPVFALDKPVETHWLGVMDNAASANGLTILKRQVGSEKLVGDVYEMAIDCKEWEGTLDALVRFLYTLESTGVMLDMRQMYIRPNPADHSRLRGSFSLYCAYMRKKDAAPVKPGTPANPVPVAKPSAAKPAAVPLAAPRRNPPPK